MGIYDEFIDKLPKLDPLDGKTDDYRQKVADHRMVIRSAAEFKQQAGYLAAVYASVRRDKDEIESELSDCNARLAAIETMMFEQMEVEGLRQIKLSDGGTVNRGYEPTAKVLDKEAFRLWCVANGLERSLQLWPSTTTAMCKERMQKGLPDPDGISTQARQKIRYSKD